MVAPADVSVGNCGACGIADLPFAPRHCHATNTETSDFLAAAPANAEDAPGLVEERRADKAALLAETYFCSEGNGTGAAVPVRSPPVAEAALSASCSASFDGSSTKEDVDVPQAAITVVVAYAPCAEQAEEPLAERMEDAGTAAVAPTQAPPDVVSASPSVAAFCPDEDEDCLAELD